jgi:hypothetical protein
MRWLLLVCVACGHPSDSNQTNQTNGPEQPVVKSKPTRTFASGDDICKAFTADQIATVTKLPADHATPSGAPQRPRCAYSKDGDANAATFVIEIRLTPSMDPIKRTFRNGRLIVGFGDEAWFHRSNGSAALHVQKGGYQVMVEMTDPTAKAFDEDKELAITEGLANAVIAKL